MRKLLQRKRVLRWKRRERLLKEKATVLEKERDYILVYDHHTEVGTATILFTGKGGYTGTRKIDFKITPHNIEYTYAVINDVVYQNKTNAY